MQHIPASTSSRVVLFSDLVYTTGRLEYDRISVVDYYLGCICVFYVVQVDTIV